jgi:hypothetical protein
MGLLITRTTGRAQASVTRDPVTHSLKASELLGIDVNHVAGPGPLITVYRLSWLQVLESAEAQGLEHPTDGGECTARAIAPQPLVGSADTDPHLSSQEGEAFTVLNVSTQQPFTAEGCQPSIRVGMHGM